MSAPGRLFEARYHGKCAGCGEAILPGHQIGYVGDSLVHGSCTDSAPPEPKTRETCTTCFIVKPCECDE